MQDAMRSPCCDAAVIIKGSRRVKCKGCGESYIVDHHSRGRVKWIGGPVVFMQEAHESAQGAMQRALTALAEREKP